MGLRVSNQPVPKRVIGFGFHPNPITDLRAAAAALAAAAARSDRPAMLAAGGGGPPAVTVVAGDGQRSPATVRERERNI